VSKDSNVLQVAILVISASGLVWGIFWGLLSEDRKSYFRIKLGLAKRPRLSAKLLPNNPHNLQPPAYVLVLESKDLDSPAPVDLELWVTSYWLVSAYVPLLESENHFGDTKIKYRLTTLNNGFHILTIWPNPNNQAANITKDVSYRLLCAGAVINKWERLQVPV
jgi:hypothetical protein